jgi:hypothetical protein
MTKESLEKYTKKERTRWKTERKQNRAAAQDLPDLMEDAAK